MSIVLAAGSLAAPAMAQRGGRGAGGDNSAPLSVPKGNAVNAGNKYKGFVYGVIKEADRDGLVLTKTAAGTDQTFKVNKKTKYIRDGKSRSLQSLKVGDEVYVAADEDKKTGDYIARKVVSGAIPVPSS